MSTSEFGFSFYWFNNISMSSSLFSECIGTNNAYCSYIRKYRKGEVDSNSFTSIWSKKEKREYSYTFMLFYFLNSHLRVCSLASKFQCITNLNRIIKIKNRLNKCSLISSSKIVDLCPVQNTNRIRIQ